MTQINLFSQRMVYTQYIQGRTNNVSYNEGMHWSEEIKIQSLS